MQFFTVIGDTKQWRAYDNDSNDNYASTVEHLDCDDESADLARTNDSSFWSRYLVVFEFGGWTFGVLVGCAAGQETFTPSRLGIWTCMRA